MVALLATAGCLITDRIPYSPDPALTPPRLRDEQSATQPRLGNVVNVETGDRVVFRVPVFDENPDDPVQFAFFLNQPRDCVDRDGGDLCAPTIGYLTLPPDGNTVRTIQRSITFNTLGCHRVELWISSAFTAVGDFHTPSRVGDVDFATWWVFVRPRPGMEGDAGVPDPAQCPTVQN